MTIQEQLDKILRNGFLLGEKESFLLEYAGLIVAFRLARINRQDASAIWAEIEAKDKVGRNFGLSNGDQEGLSTYFRDKNVAELEWLEQRIRSKVSRRGE